MPCPTLDLEDDATIASFSHYDCDTSDLYPDRGGSECHSDYLDSKSVPSMGLDGVGMWGRR
jgi:hypothetical protein